MANSKRGPKAKGEIIERAGGRLVARIPVVKDGETVRKLFDLATTDRAVARRRVKRLLANADTGGAGDLTAEAKRPDTLREYFEANRSELSAGDADNIRLHVLARRDVGSLAVADLRVSHVKAVRDETLESMSRLTAIKVLGALRRLLALAVEDEVIETNPARDVRVKPLRGAERVPKKRRAILTNPELAAYLAWKHPDEQHPERGLAVRERQTMALLARMFGGLRTGDLHALRWETHFDVPAFTEGIAPRQKTATPQRLAVPAELRPFLVAWWAEHGEPRTGVVFPALRDGRPQKGQRGARAGEDAKHGVSHAEALRRDLFRAGVRRHDCARHPPMLPATWGEPCCEAFATNPLYSETPTTRPVDFHSGRRAFATALAASGVNVQLAMRLAGHADAATHLRYVGEVGALALPDSAVPKLAGNQARELGTAPRIW